MEAPAWTRPPRPPRGGPLGLCRQVETYGIHCRPRQQDNRLPSPYGSEGTIGRPTPPLAGRPRLAARLPTSLRLRARARRTGAASQPPEPRCPPPPCRRQREQESPGRNSPKLNPPSRHEHRPNQVRRLGQTRDHPRGNGGGVHSVPAAHSAAGADSLGGHTAGCRAARRVECGHTLDSPTPPRRYAGFPTQPRSPPTWSGRAQLPRGVYAACQ